MATKIVTKNSSTASAVPTASDLVQGELAVNVADKRLFTEDNAGAIVELGTNPSTLTVTGEITANGGIALGDSNIATFGASDDLQIYHNGAHSFIKDVGTGNLYIDATSLYVRSATGEPYIVGTADAGVSIYHDNAVKLATTSTGIDVTGTVVSDGLTVSGNLDVDGGTIKLDGNYPTGTNNVALGDAAFASSLSGDSNVAIGYQSHYSLTSGSANTAVGRGSLFSNTTASNNTALGYLSLSANTTGSENTAVGQIAMDSNTTGGSNVAVGQSALGTNTTGSSNIAIGVDSLNANTTASNNTAVGHVALRANTTGANNTTLGYRTGILTTTGSQNTLIGADSGGSNTTGTLNTFVGADSGYYVTTGAKNTIIGKYNGNQGGLDIRTSSNNIVLSDGDGNPRFHVNSNGQAVVGSSSYQGIDNGTNLGVGIQSIGRLITCTANGGNVFEFNIQGTGSVGSINVSGSSTSYNTSSDHRLKENVSYTWDATTRLKQLKPARFNFITDADTTVDGFLAHEAQAVVPECVTGTKDAVDADGNPVYQGIDQSKLVPLLVKTIQELEARITALEGA